MAHAAFLRSPYANARIVKVDVSAARRHPGVLAAITFADLGSNPSQAADARPASRPSPADALPARGRPGAPRRRAGRRGRRREPLCGGGRARPDRGGVRGASRPVDAEAALRPDAPLLHEGMPPTTSPPRYPTTWATPTARSPRRTRLDFDFRFGRLSGQPLETRGIVASYEPGKLGDTLKVWDSTQAPHTARRILADMLGMPQHAIRVIAPDVGGGFGIKNRFYREEFVVPFLARRLGRPVRWIEDRREDLPRRPIRRASRSTTSRSPPEATARSSDCGIATSSTWAPTRRSGSWSRTTPPRRSPARTTCRNYRAEMRAVFTNKAPMAPYRAAGRPPAVFAMERAMDLVARKLGIRPGRSPLPQLRAAGRVSLRARPRRPRRHRDLLRQRRLSACLRKALDLIDAAAFRREQEAARAQGAISASESAVTSSPRAAGPSRARRCASSHRARCSSSRGAPAGPVARDDAGSALRRPPGR